MPLRPLWLQKCARIENDHHTEVAITMTAPNPETRATDPLRKRRKRIRYDVVFGVVVVLLLALLIRNNVKSAQVVWKSTLAIHDLSQENVVQERILKSCLPVENPKCKEFILEGSKTQRVAIVSPPGLLATALERMVDHAVAQRTTLGTDDFEFIRTSHVPPYGYGKTHGLTKIIRLVPQPLVLGVTDMFLNGRDPSSLENPVSVGDLKVTLRQLLRFHCRLSHVTAHTAMLTIPLNDLWLNPDQVVEQLRLFLGITSNQHIRTAMEVHQTRKEWKEETSATLRSVRSSSVALLSQVVSSDLDDMMGVLSIVLKQELFRTKNLTDWPCLSFWSAGEDPPDPFSLAPESQRIAAALSPNCSAAFSNCWVDRDVCEAKGDGPCQKK